MSDREIKLFETQISHKFSSVDEAQKVVNACVNFIRYQAKQRHFFCQAIIGVSQLKSDNIVAIKQQQTNLKGRPITQRVFNTLEFVDSELREIEPIPIQKQPHIHCLVLSSPGEMFAEMIVDYLAKKLDTTDTNGDKTKVRKMPLI